MSFQRTVQGISNLATFHCVDFIVFTEGKVDDPSISNGCHDKVFWHRMFGIFSPQKKVKVLSRGSKTDLIPIAEDVANGRISKTIVTFDRDYDDIIGNPYSHPMIIYTYGYSWENDIWCTETIGEVIQSLSLVQPVPQSAISLMQNSLLNFFSCASRLVRANLSALANGCDPVVCTADLRGLVVLDKHHPPRFNKSFLLLRISKFKVSRSAPLFSGVTQIAPQQRCNGHLLGHFGFHLVCYTLRQLGQKAKVDFDLMTVSTLLRQVSRVGQIWHPV